MNDEAVRRLRLARSQGMAYDQLADLYELLKTDIEEAADGSWTADRAECVDGTIVFVGSGGHALAILRSGRMYVGTTTGSPAFLTAIGGRYERGQFLFGPVNTSAARREL